jgi:hypothetical protein
MRRVRRRYPPLGLRRASERVGELLGAMQEHSKAPHTVSLAWWARSIPAAIRSRLRRPGVHLQAHQRELPERSTVRVRVRPGRDRDARAPMQRNSPTSSWSSGATQTTIQVRDPCVLLPHQ